MLYFPRPYPGELGGSLLVRACRHLGLSYRRLMAHITGTRRSHSPFLIVPHLPRIARLAGTDPEKFLWEHTVFPYVTAFMSHTETMRFRDSILMASADGVRCLGALTQSAVDAVPYRRYCSSCQHLDTITYGEPYWHRIHNLPAVYFCPIHQERLQITTVALPRPAAAESNTLPGESQIKTVDVGPSMTSLCALAARTQSVMQRDHPRTDTWTIRYRQLAHAKGYGLSGGDLAGHQLSRDLHGYFGPGLLALANAEVHLNRRNPWPSLMIRKRTTIPFSPIKHILLGSFLDECSASQKNIAYPRPGPRQHNHACEDQTIVRSLQDLMERVSKGEQKYTIMQLLSQVGAWQQFRHNRHAYPRTRAFLDWFLTSPWSQRRYPAKSV